jgi:hypothetical protein
MTKTDANRIFSTTTSVPRKTPTYLGRLITKDDLDRVAKMTPAYREPVTINDLFRSSGFAGFR